MSRLLILFLPVAFSYADCTPTKTSKEIRRELIEKSVIALKANDTLQLFRMMDTAECFKVYGKDGFMNNVNYLHSKFKDCSAIIQDSIEVKPIHYLPFSQYILPFCRDSSGMPVSTSFDLIFTFADYDNKNQIVGMNVEKYLFKGDSLKLPPPIHPPGHSLIIPRY